MGCKNIPFPMTPRSHVKKIRRRTSPYDSNAMYPFLFGTPIIFMSNLRRYSKPNLNCFGL